MNHIIVFDFNRTLYDPDHKTLIPHAQEILDTARAKGYTLVLLSKAGPDREQLVKENGLDGYFAETIFTGAKTHELFEQIAEHHQADKTRSYVIGDRAQGEIKHGHEGGWNTIWLKAGRFEDELPDPDKKPDYIISNLDEALRII